MKNGKLSLRTLCSTLLLAVLLTSGTAAFGGPVRAETPASVLRFGVATNNNPGDYADSQGLKMGWYHNWSSRPWNLVSPPDGVQFYPMVGAWGDLWGVESEAALRGAISLSPQSYPKGTIWIVSNEPQYDKFNKANGITMPERIITLDEYAQKYKKYYDMIKGIDPTYRIAIAASYGSWITDVQQAYEQRYHTKMPIDVYNTHAYMDTGHPLDILNQVKVQVNNTRQTMKLYGDRDKWLIITETGALYDPGAAIVTGFMKKNFDYLSSAVNADLGCPSDGNRLVQRWAWFALTSRQPGGPIDRWKGTALIEVGAPYTGTMTVVGHAYADYPKGPPMLPSAFYGTATRNGRSVPAGTQVTGWISDTVVVTTTTMMSGTLSIYVLDVPGDDADTPVIEGGVAGVTVRFKIGANWATETGIWQSGETLNQSLTQVVYAGTPSIWIRNYGAGSTAGSWASQDTFPRILADVNNDGKADVIGFGGAGTYVSLSNGSGFGALTLWSRGYGTSSAAGGWSSNNTYPRLSGDVNGDGKADIVGFGGLGAYVSLSTGTGFGPMALWSRSFGASVAAGSWSDQNNFPRFLADVNGDGKADIVGFGGAGVYVALGTGTGFGSMTKWSSSFGTSPAAGNWINQDTFPRMLADVNGDRKADIVGFGGLGAYVSLSTGTGFGPMRQWSSAYGVAPAAGGWSNQNTYPRMLADVNHDGKADIVGFQATGTFASLSNGTSFGAPISWIQAFGTSAGAGSWASQRVNPRAVADINGDGNADIVGFANDGSYVSISYP